MAALKNNLKLVLRPRLVERPSAAACRETKSSVNENVGKCKRQKMNCAEQFEDLEIW